MAFSREDLLAKVPGVVACLDRVGNDFKYKPLRRIERQAAVHLGLIAERSIATKALPIYSPLKRTAKIRKLELTSHLA